MVRRSTGLIALALAMCLLLSGCAFRLDPPRGSVDAEQTARRPTRASDAFETEMSDASGTEDPGSFETEDSDAFAIEDPDAVDYRDMEYERPDADAIERQIQDVIGMLRAGEPDEAVADALYALDEAYYAFNTMAAIAYIEYCKDLSSAYYEEEYNMLDKENAALQAAFESLYLAVLDAGRQEQLEELYFGEGFLDYYKTHRVYSNPEFVALSQQETDLVTQFMNLQDAPAIEFKGETRDFWSLVEEYSDDYITLYDEILPAYYETYNAKAAEIYVQLIRLRRQMGELAGYETYADYMYEYYYAREYTPAMARSYIAAMKEAVVPAQYRVDAALGEDSYDYMPMEQSAGILSDALEQMDSTYYAFFQFMRSYHLWDCAVSESKMTGSYETYLYSYAEPFVYMSPQETEADILTLAHEFGHFTEAMWNDGNSTDIDVSEIFSQALELMTLRYIDLPESQVERLTRLKLVDFYDIFLYQTAYADFEDRVYQLPDQRLRADTINDLYETVMEEYGLTIPGMDWYNRLDWIDVNHFFTAPCYVISYCVSADVALQVYQLERENLGDGLDMFRDLLDLSPQYGFLELVEEAGLSSPFDAGRPAELMRRLVSWCE